jgi:hypothetical protein
MNSNRDHRIRLLKAVYTGNTVRIQEYLEKGKEWVVVDFNNGKLVVEPPEFEGFSLEQVLKKSEATFKVPIPINLKVDKDYQQLIDNWNNKIIKDGQQYFRIHCGMLLSF